MTIQNLQPHNTVKMAKKQYNLEAEKFKTMLHRQSKQRNVHQNNGQGRALFSS
jgi:hypothetical protein